MYYTYYSVALKGDPNLVRSNNNACYAQWVHQLDKLDRVVVHLALTEPLSGNSILKYTKQQVFRYLRALQRSGFKFTFSANNIMLKRVRTDLYDKVLPEANQEKDTICYNIDIDLTKCSHINAQIVMFCVRFLHEKTKIADAFLKFLDEDAKSKKKSDTTPFDKMLIAMRTNPGSGHSFGANSGYNLLLGKDGFKKYITDCKVTNGITSTLLPKTKSISYELSGDLHKVLIMIEKGDSFQEILKIYKEICLKYT